MKNVSGVTQARRRWRWLSKTLLGFVAVSALTSCLPKSGSEVESSFLGGIVVSKNQSHLTVSNSTLQPSDTSTVLITLLDQNGNAYISPKPLSINLSASGGTSNGTFSAITDNGDGTYTSTFTATHSGTATNIVASINGALLDEQPSIRVLSGTLSLSNSVVTVSALSVTSGSSLTVTLTTMDTHNNALGVGGSTVSFATSGGASTGSFSAVTDNGDGSYSATFTGLLSGAATTITCQIDGQSITSSLPSVTVNPGATTHFTLTGISSPLTAGSSQTLNVTAQDANGNTTPSYTGTVSFTTTSTSKTLPANYTFTSGAGLDNGVHSFAGVQLKTSGTQSVTATDTVTASITGSITSLTVNPGSTSVLSVSGFTSPATSATSYSFTVTAQDAYGNTTPSYTGTVAFTSSAATKSLPANYTFTSGSGLDNGTHSFSGSITTAGTQSITATDTVTGSITGSQSSITVYPVVSFSVASQDVAINQGTATVTVSLNTPAGTGQTVTVPITTNASSTAVNNTDYTLSTTSLSFSPGQSSKTITVTLIDQLSPATNNATITLDLGTLTYGVAGSTTAQTLTIRSPSLDLNFAALYDPVTQMSQAPFNQITFTRSSTATYTDCDGLIKTAANNVPRIDCNPITGQPKGFLIEEARTNSLIWSSNLTNWFSLNGLTFATSSAIAPDGTRSSVAMTPTGVASLLYRNATIVSDSSSWTCSAFLKQGTSARSMILLNFWTGTNVSYSTQINWATQTLVGTTASATASMVSYPNGWFRVIVSGANNNSGNTLSACYLYPDSLNGSGTALAWGPQLEQGTFATSYIPTTTAAATRQVDFVDLSSTFGTWMNASLGTFAIEGETVYAPVVASNFAFWFQADKDPANRLGLYIQSGALVPYWQVSSTTDSNVLAMGSLASNASTRYAMVYNTDDMIAAYGGTLTTADTTVTPPTGLTHFYIGRYANQYINGAVKRFTAYQQRLSNSALQTLSNTSASFRSYAPKVNLTTTTQTVIEPQGTVYVTAALSEPATATLTVPYTVGGTAGSGTNYSGLSSGNLTFAAGESRKTLSFSLLDDGGSTSPTITVTLGSGTGFNLGTNTTQTITIQRPALDLNFAAMYDPATQMSQSPYSNLTFTRASTATYVDADGLIKTAATNVPRIDHNPSTKQPNGLLIEESRTNSAKSSGDLSNVTYWVNSNSPGQVGNSAFAPDGTYTAATISDASAATTPYIYVCCGVTASNSQTWSGSVYIKKDSTTARFPVLQIAYSNGTTPLNFYAWLNTQTGAVTASGSATATTVGAQDAGSYWRLWLVAANNATGNTRLDLQVFPAGGSAIGTFSSAATGSIIAWGAQLELGAFATSYIPTTTATVTRAADYFYSSSISSWYNASAGTMLINATTNTAAPTGGYSYFLSLDDGTNNNQFRLLNMPAIAFQSYAGGAFQQSAGYGSVVASTPTLFTSIYNASDNVFSKDGGPTIVGSGGPLGVPSGVSSLYLGSFRGGTYSLNGTMNRFTYYGARLSNVQAAILSASTLYTPRSYTPTVTLTKSSQSVLQSEGQAFFVAALNEPARSTITVPYTISGTAVSGTDYSGLSSGTLTFTAGQSRAVASFTVSTTANTGRTVIMTLGSPTGATAGAITAQTIYLINATTGLALTSSTVINNGTTVTFSGTCGPGMTITISGTQSATTTCTAGGTWTWTSSTISSDGSYSFNFTQSNGIQSGSAVAGTYNRDATAPTTVTSLTDGNYTTNATQSPTMTWPATTDPTVNSYNSGVSYYMLAIGTTAGGTDVVNWTNVGNVTSYQLTGLSLTNGTMYYGSIKAVDNAGNASAVRQGDGFAVVTDTPSLALDFITGSNRLTSTNASSPAMVQFSRASGANVSPGTYYNSSGTLTNAPLNMLTSSQNFSTWGAASAGTYTLTANSSTAPDGTTTATLITDTDSTNVSGISKGTASYPAGIYVFSAYLKLPTSGACVNPVRFQLNGPSVNAGIRANLSTGTLAAYFGSPTSQSITAVGNGWYRVSLTLTEPSAGAWAAYLHPSWIGTETCSVLMWGAQIEAGSTPTDYIYTSGSAAYGPRLDYDPSSCSGTCTSRGLLIEQASTNIIPSSSDISAAGWSLNGGTIASGNATAPDGTASKSVQATGNFHGVWYYQATPAINTSYTFSVYLKNISGGSLVRIGDSNANGCWASDTVSTFNLSTGAFTLLGPSVWANSVQNAGNGWWRVSITSTTVGTSCTYAGQTIYSMNGATASEIAIWGAQIEALPYPTSYIPTAGTSLTRNADVASVTNMTPLSTAQGTLVVSGTSGPSFNNVTVNAGFVMASLESASNRIQMRRLAGGTTVVDGKFGVYLNGAGAGLFNTGNGSFPMLTTKTVAQAYSSTDTSAAWGGALLTGAPSSGGITPFTPTQLLIGNSYLFGTYFNGWIQSVRFYSNRLSDSSLKGLTAP